MGEEVVKNMTFSRYIIYGWPHTMRAALFRIATAVLRTGYADKSSTKQTTD